MFVARDLLRIVIVIHVSTNSDPNIGPPLVHAFQFACSPLIQLSPNLMHIV